LEVKPGCFLALLGPSGCGKTTLLRLIAGFEVPDHGTVELAGKAVAGPGAWVPPERRGVGVVFQDYALFPHMDVAGNIAYGLPRDTDRKRKVEEMLCLVGLQGYQSRMPHQLSGGEQQRVALARALAPSPELLLMDEPFSNLDADLRIRIRAEVKNILACSSTTVVFVTHDQEEALFLGDLVGVMNAGRLEQVGAPEAVYHRPATPFVAHFVGTADFLPGEVGDDFVETELGRLPGENGLAPGAHVTVMVRPEAIIITPDGDGMASVTEKVFRGREYLYTVRLPSGALVRSSMDHETSYPLGTRVSVGVQPGRHMAYFLGHSLVHPAPNNGSPGELLASPAG